MSRKGEAKKRKAEMLRNKKLIERYPWIWPVDWHWKTRETFWIDTSDSFYKHVFYNKQEDLCDYLRETRN
jgi:hypothetical protein